MLTFLMGVQLGAVKSFPSASDRIKTGFVATPEPTPGAFGMPALALLEQPEVVVIVLPDKPARFSFSQHWTLGNVEQLAFMVALNIRLNSV